MKRNRTVILSSFVVALTFPAFGQETCGAPAQHFEKALGIDVAYGCLIEDIQAGSLAEQQALVRGDLLISLNDKAFRDFPNTKEFSQDAKGAAAGDRATIKVLRFNGQSYSKNPDIVHFTIHAARLAEKMPALGFKCKGEGVVLTTQGSPLSGTDIRPGDFILQIGDQIISSTDVTSKLAENSSKNLPYLDNPLMIDMVVRDVFESKSDVVTLIFGRWAGVADGKRELQARVVVLPKAELMANRK
jgi:membrane-associated protease RseP (regulator of RpoE activity)